jgi:hypothetical protein
MTGDSYKLNDLIRKRAESRKKALWMTLLGLLGIVVLIAGIAGVSSLTPRAGKTV